SSAMCARSATAKSRPPCVVSTRSSAANESSYLSNRKPCPKFSRRPYALERRQELETAPLVLLMTFVVASTRSPKPGDERRGGLASRRGGERPRRTRRGIGYPK